jgi:spore coat polysaccharide biosynthesis protein SpsF (cytidylyltransferase family)
MTFFYRTPLEKIDFVFNDTSVARDINLAIDTSEDFEKAKKILDIMDKPHVNYGFKEIIALFDKIEDGKH